MGLRAKLLVTLLGLLMLSLVVMSAGAYFYFKNRLQAEALSYQRNIASQMLIGARAEIARVTSVLRQLSEDSSLVAEVERALDATSPQISADLQRDFENFQRYTADLQQVVLFDSRGRTLLGAPVGQPRLERLDLALLRREEYVTEDGVIRRFHAGKDGRYRLQALARVYSRQHPEQLLGYVAVSSQLDAFQQMVDENDSAVTRLFFGNNSGDLLVRSAELGLDALPSGAMTPFVEGDGFDNGHSFLDLAIAGKDYRLYLQRVTPDLWLGAIIDEDAIADGSLALLPVLLPVAALAFLLAGWVFYLRVSGAVLKPIELLIQATRQISAGEYRPHIPIHSDDELGELADAFRVMGRQLQDSSQQISQLAYFDPLTKLPNRTTLRFTLQQMIEEARRSKKRLAVLFIDLDDFKKVNDRLGHEAGDELLVQVGRRLQNRLRTGDMLADTSNTPRATESETLVAKAEQLISRRGGDEFNAILNNVHSAREAALVAERLIVDINEPVQIGGSSVSVGASIGVAVFPEDGDSADMLLRHADMAMYAAKGLGKNKYYLFTETINTQVHQRLELEQSISRGLQNQEFEVFYQPKINLQTRQLAGFEALMRWRCPSRGMVSPAEFIPLAEESQLIHDLGHWMMAETLHQLHDWLPRLPAGVRVAINISARQMAQENFSEHLFSVAEQFGVPFDRLEVELTETSILHDEVLVRQHLYALRAAGVRVSLDDFGTGYSSLTFLRSLPIDSVKIDRSFVMRLLDDDESRAIVLSVLDLCAKLSLDTVAEGVETDEQYQLLRRHGCSEAQGYLIARPMPAAEVMAFVEN